VLDGDGFPKAREMFAGNRSDPITVAEMLGVLEKRLDKKKDATVIVDRGTANDENLSTIRNAGYHWLVAARFTYRRRLSPAYPVRYTVRENPQRNLSDPASARAHSVASHYEV
jgi:hypothetical protein